MTTPTLPAIVFVRGDTVTLTGTILAPPLFTSPADLTGITSLTGHFDCASPQCSFTVSLAAGSIVVATPASGGYVVTIASSVSLLMPDQAADIVGRWRRPMIVSQF